MPTAISESRYAEANENHEGWCKICQDFTKDQCEPDDNGYKCPVCGEMSVIGAENAILSGQIEFSDEDDEAC